MTMVIDGSSGLTYPNSSTQASSSVVLQVVQNTYSTQTSTTSSTFSSTGLSASITPKFSTSKILIMVYQPFATYNVSGASGGNFQVQRSGTVVAGASSGTGYQVYLSVSGQLTGTCTFSGLDSPATTSSTTYTVYMNCQTGAVYAQSNNLTSYIQLLEIAG